MSKRILVMEDEKDNRQIIRDLLGGIDCEITRPKTPSRRSQLSRRSGPISS